MNNEAVAVQDDVLAARAVVESVGRALFDDRYLLHKSWRAAGTVTPFLPSLLDSARGSTSYMGALERGETLLRREGSSDLAAYVGSVRDTVAMQRALALSVPGALTITVGRRTYSLDEPQDRLDYRELAYIERGAHTHIHDDRPTVLVLGTYWPHADAYFDNLFAGSDLPIEKFARDSNLSHIEQVQLATHVSRAAGWRALSALGSERRRVDNVFLRIAALMETASRIVIFLCHDGMGANVEYGYICGTRHLARKTTVFWRKGSFTSAVAARGSFMLDSPSVLEYEDDAQWTTDLERILHRAD